MKIAITIITGILLISLASALTGGECKTVSFPNTNPVQITITNNQSNMDGFNWTKTGTQIEYCVSIDFEPQNFTAKWWNTEEVEVSSSSGGSGSIIFGKKILGTANVTDEINTTDEDFEHIVKKGETTIIPGDEPKRIGLLGNIIIGAVLMGIVILGIYLIIKSGKMKNE